MKFLVTGGFGFIGGHLIQRLLEAEHTVHVVDNLSTSPVPLTVLMSDLKNPPNLTYDIDDLHNWLHYNDDTEWDVIFHLASPVGPAGILPFAGKMAYYIVRDTVKLIRLAQRSNARLVDVSTSEIYGGGEAGYCREDMPRIVPAETTVRLEYAMGKLAAETALINECQINDLRAAIIRPFNVSGPRQSGQGGFVLPRFVAQAMTGQPLTVFGDGSQVRAFTHVRDIVSGIIEAADYLNRYSRKARGQAFNLGNPANKTTILNLAERVINEVGSASAIQFLDGREVYGPHYAEAADKYPDASRAIKELRWQPQYDIEATIRSVHLYMTWSAANTFHELSGIEAKHPLWTV